MRNTTFSPPSVCLILGEQQSIVLYLLVFLVHGSNPAQHVNKLFSFRLICQRGDRDCGVAVELSHSVSQPFTIWFTGLIHLEQGNTGNKPILEVEQSSTTSLYLDQGKQQDDRLPFACKAPQPSRCVDFLSDFGTVCLVYNMQRNGVCML